MSTDGPNKDMSYADVMDGTTKLTTNDKSFVAGKYLKVTLRLFDFFGSPVVPTEYESKLSVIVTGPK